jgi:hypothetical protein
MPSTVNGRLNSSHLLLSCLHTDWVVGLSGGRPFPNMFVHNRWRALLAKPEYIFCARFCGVPSRFGLELATGDGAIPEAGNKGAAESIGATKPSPQRKRQATASI